MASVFNTGIALGFAFTRTKTEPPISPHFLGDGSNYTYIFGENPEVQTEEGFSLLLYTLKKKCPINFEEQIIETYQGTGLMSSIKLHKMIHLKCLKHFLKNVQSNIYFYNVKELIECCTTFEFEFASKKKKNIWNIS